MQHTYIAPQQPIPRYFTIQLVNNQILCNLRLILQTKKKKNLKIPLHNQGGIGLPLDAVKFVETENASYLLRART